MTNKKVIDRIIQLKYLYSETLKNNGIRFESLMPKVLKDLLESNSNLDDEASQLIINTSKSFEKEAFNKVKLALNYGVATKYRSVYYVFETFEEMRDAFESPVGESLSKILDILNSDSKENFDNIFSAIESSGNIGDRLQYSIKDIKNTINKHYTHNIVYMITLGIFSELDRKYKHVNNSVLQINNIDKLLKIVNHSSFSELSIGRASDSLMLIGMYSLFMALNHDFNDKKHWPFKDDLDELIINQLSKFKITDSIIKKIQLLDIKDLGGLDLSEVIGTQIICNIIQTSK